MRKPHLENRIYDEQPHDPGGLKRFTIGSEVRLKVSGGIGIVRFANFQPGQLGEYRHRIEYLLDGQPKYRHEPGCNLELIHQPVRQNIPVFDEVREHAISLRDAAQRLEILERTEALELAQSTPSWSQTYMAFTAFASEHPVTREWVAPLLEKLDLWRLRQVKTEKQWA